MTDREDMLMDVLLIVVIVFLVQFSLSGCSTLIEPDNELRLTSYKGAGSGGGLMTDFSGDVTGCRVVEVGHVTACVELLDGSCRAWTCSIEGLAVPDHNEPVKPIDDYSQGVK